MDVLEWRYSRQCLQTAVGIAVLMSLEAMQGRMVRADGEIPEVMTASRLSVGVEKGIRHNEALTAKREEPSIHSFGKEATHHMHQHQPPQVRRRHTPARTTHPPSVPRIIGVNRPDITATRTSKE